MTHTETIWIVVTLSLVSTLGVYSALRVIKLYTWPTGNVLVRRGDIELADYIQPNQQNNLDLLENPTPIFDRVAIYDRVPSYWSGVPPYQPGTIPSYHTYDRLQINSCLEYENIINLYFIWIIFTCLLIIILKMKSLYAMSILIPFSLFDIDFRDSFEWELESYRVKPQILYMCVQTLTKDLINLLDSLNDDVNYSMGLSYISSYKEWEDKVIPLWIDNALIINKESDPILISQFIMNRLIDKGLFITNRLFNDSSINSMDPVILTVIVGIKVKI